MNIADDVDADAVCSLLFSMNESEIPFIFSFAHNFPKITFHFHASQAPQELFLQLSYVFRIFFFVLFRLCVPSVFRV